ncbi:MAG: hypothetical protein H6581_29800 [Bacteroidia bacterium]|nr:hypothetical protein [Bacteroidia bacterium]
MKRTFNASLVSFFLFWGMMAQAQTWLGGEIGMKWDVARSSSTGSGISARPVAGGMARGLTVSHYLVPFLEIQTGVNYQEYYMGQTYHAVFFDNFQSFTDIYRVGTCLQVPVRAKIHFPIEKDRWTVFGLVGNSLNLKREMEPSRIEQAGHAQLSYIYEGPVQKARVFPLAELGFGVAHKIKKHFQLTWTFSRYFGFAKVAESRITYNNGFSPIYYARIHSLGDYFRMTVGLSYEVFHLWN